MASPGEIVLASQPDLPDRAHMRDVSAVSVMIDPGLLFGVAGGPLENASPKTILFESMRPVNPAAGLLWRDTVRYIQRCVLADDSIATPLVLEHASRLLAAATLIALGPRAGAEAEAGCGTGLPTTRPAWPPPRGRIGSLTTKMLKCNLVVTAESAPIRAKGS